MCNFWEIKVGNKINIGDLPLITDSPRRCKGGVDPLIHFHSSYMQEKEGGGP